MELTTGDVLEVTIQSDSPDSCVTSAPVFPGNETFQAVAVILPSGLAKATRMCVQAREGRMGGNLHVSGPALVMCLPPGLCSATLDMSL